MTFQATDDLQGYLKDAVLPRLKLAHKPEMKLHQRYRSRQCTLTVRSQLRNLSNIIYLDSEFDGLVNEWIEEHVPNRSLCLHDEDRRSGERFTVPSSPRFNIPELLLPAASDISRVCDWLDNFPLQTVQRAFHIIFPATKEWRFTTLDDDGLFKRFYWTDINGDDPDTRDASVVVVCQPPWLMSDELMSQFTQLKSLPEGTTRASRGKERLWSRLWDTCVHNQTPFFVLTSYQQWVFGMFSCGWTTAFVSPVIDAQSRSPTVMHALLYWLGSALRAPGGFAQPVEVAEPVPNIFSDYGSGLQITEPEKGLEVASSLSSWSGTSGAELASSAGAADAVALDVSDRGVDEPHSADVLFKKPKDLALTWKMVESWRRQLPIKRASDGVPAPCSAISDALYLDLFDNSATSDTSDETEVGVPRGHWLMSALRR